MSAICRKCNTYFFTDNALNASGLCDNCEQTEIDSILDIKPVISEEKREERKGMLDTISSFSRGAFEECNGHPELHILDSIVTGGKDRKQMDSANMLIFFDTSYMPKNVLLCNFGYTSEPCTDKRIIYFPIVDQYTPDKKLLTQLLDWIDGQIGFGNQHIHMQCIGGHGRTGLVLACLVHRVLGIDNPVKWVKENYCKKAVESDRQYQFIADFTGTLLYERNNIIKNNIQKEGLFNGLTKILSGGHTVIYPKIDRDEVCGRCNYGITRHGNSCHQFKSINLCHKK